MESRYSCKSFPAKKIESTIFGGNSCSYLDAAATANIFSWQWLANKLFQFYAFFFVTEAFERSQEFF